MILINCKVHLELNWIEDCILSIDGDPAKFKITDAKLYVPIVTLSTKDNVNLTKELNDGFKQLEQLKLEQLKVMNKGANIYKLLSTSFQGVKRLFVLAYVIAANAENNEVGIKNNKKSFLQRGEIKDYNVLIDGRNFYDHSVNDLIKQYDEMRKAATGQGNDDTTRCLLYIFQRQLQTNGS